MMIVTDGGGCDDGCDDDSDENVMNVNETMERRVTTNAWV